MKLASYHISDLRIHAYIGLYEEEKKKGNDFLVNVTYQAPYEDAAKTDALEYAVNYGAICELIEECFQARCDLVEQIAQQTVSSIKEKFPQISGLSVTITKLNPPVSQQVKGISITVNG